MRDRVTSDWVTDLGSRHALEAQVGAALGCHRGLQLITSSTETFNRLDFQLHGPSGQLLEVELKAKLQPLSASWTQLRSEVDPADLFVLDELALRKIMDAGRLGFLLVRDAPSQRWALWSTGDLLVTSRVRTSRVLRKSATPIVKGKLLLDLSEAAYVGDLLAGTLDALVEMTNRVDSWWQDVAPWPKIGIGAR